MSDNDDLEAARRIFETQWADEPDGSRTGPAINDPALQLLKSDPGEYFRLSEIWARR